MQIEHGGLPVPRDVRAAARECGAWRQHPVVTVGSTEPVDTLEVIEWKDGGTAGLESEELLTIAAREEQSEIT